MKDALLHFTQEIILAQAPGSDCTAAPGRTQLDLPDLVPPEKASLPVFDVPQNLRTFGLLGSEIFTHNVFVRQDIPQGGC